MTINILFFGACREAADGVAEISLDLASLSRGGETPGNPDVLSVWQSLAGRYPALARFNGNVLFAVNEEYARGDKLLVAGDTLAIFPPVSGG
jgi:molybdopterin converting factor small subunit